MLSFPEFLVPVLVGIAVMSMGGALVVLGHQRREARLARQRALRDRDIAREEGSHRPRMFEAVERVGEIASSGRVSASLKEELASAGFYGEQAAGIFIGAKVLLLIVGLVIASLIFLPMGLETTTKIFLIALCGAALLFVPNLVVAIQRGRRRREVERHLPDSIDMLDICVSAGMGIDMAWNAVSEEMRRVSTVFADEMELTNLEIRLGVPRASAMRNMAERTGAEDISSLVALLVQAERFGASIVDALRTFALSMREARGQRAQEAAERMSVKLLFPMVLFIFPTLLIVMVGPAVLELLRVMG
jgi:tight adherence protein C